MVKEEIVVIEKELMFVIEEEVVMMKLMTSETMAIKGEGMGEGG